jgi:hypothetical protein
VFDLKQLSLIHIQTDLKSNQKSESYKCKALPKTTTNFNDSKNEYGTYITNSVITTDFIILLAYSLELAVANTTDIDIATLRAPTI